MLDVRYISVPAGSITLLRSEGSFLTFPQEKWPSTPVEELLRAEPRYIRAAFYPCATGGSGPCDGSEAPAYARMRPPPPAPRARAPTTDPCLDSNGSARPACAALLHCSRGYAPPRPSTDGF